MSPLEHLDYRRRALLKGVMEDKENLNRIVAEAKETLDRLSYAADLQETYSTPDSHLIFRRVSTCLKECRIYLKRIHKTNKVLSGIYKKLDKIS